jgi:phospholipid/cholesterol/gamma-HCH transport system substrate-binding protein
MVPFAGCGPGRGVNWLSRNQLKMRATNLLIGTTTLAVIAAAFVGMLSVQKMRATQQRSPLRIVFGGSASGLRKGGPVNFDGVPAGEIMSIKLESPRKIVALLMLDNSAPIRQDTAVGIEFQGLTGVAAISLVGGAAGAAPVPLDEDGIPVLTADWSEQQSITDTLHNVDRVIVDNQEQLKDALLSFKTYTASLKSKSDAVDSAIDQAEDTFASIDKAVAKIDGVIPGLADGRPGALFEKVKSIRELADSFRQKSATVMEEGRRTLLDISEAANNFDRKIKPRAAGAAPPLALPRSQGQKRH